MDIFGSETENSGSSQTNPWEEAIPTLKKILEDANEIYDQQGGINADWIEKEFADMAPELQQALYDMLNAQGMKDMLGSMDQAIKSGMSGIGQASSVLGDFASGNMAYTADDINQMAAELFNSELVASQTQMLADTVNEQLSGQINTLNQQASTSGNMGSSRAGVAEGVATTGAAEEIATGTAQITNAAMQDAYGQAMKTLGFNQKSQADAAKALGQLGIASGQLGGQWMQGYNSVLDQQLKAGMIIQQYNQNKLDNDWFNQQGQANMGWAQLDKLLGITAPIAGMGGSTESESESSTGLFR